MDLFVKPTDANNYLHYSSAHWRSCKDSLSYSQFICIRRICKRLSDFDKHCLEKALHFKRRGYPMDVIARAYVKARNRDRTELLVPKPKQTEDDKVIAMTRHHPSCHVFSKSL